MQKSSKRYSFCAIQDLNASKLFADEASAIYERATTTVLKRNPLVYYVYAEFEEVRSNCYVIMSLFFSALM